MKKMFTRHGIPKIIISENMPQYLAEDFKYFSQFWGFPHITSSPLHPSRNGLAKKTVRTLTDLVDNTELESALLSYHSAPLACCYTPAQLLMAHRLRSKVSATASSLKSQVTIDFTHDNNLDKAKGVLQFNHRRAARSLVLLVM